MFIPDNFKFFHRDSWVRQIDDFTAICGITDFIIEKFGQIVFAELPENTIDLSLGEKIGYLETQSDLIDLISPLSGRILEVNDNIENDLDSTDHFNLNRCLT